MSQDKRPGRSARQGAERSRDEKKGDPDRRKTSDPPTKERRRRKKRSDGKPKGTGGRDGHERVSKRVAREK